MIDIFKQYNINEKDYNSYGWGLSTEQLNILGNLISNNKFNNIIEFGHGFSSKFITDLLNKINKTIYIESFENNLEFIQKIDYTSYDLKVRPLIECSDDDYNLMFNNKEIDKNKFSLRKDPPECTQKNCFYDIQKDDIQQDFYDFLLLDGPNGNGRNFAFLYLKNKLKKGSYIFIDDYNHYDFLEKCQDIFNVEILMKVINEKSYVLLKVL